MSTKIENNLKEVLLHIKDEESKSYLDIFNKKLNEKDLKKNLKKDKILTEYEIDNTSVKNTILNG